MEALINKFLTPTPPTRDEGFGLSDPGRNEHYHLSFDKEKCFNDLQETKAMFERGENNYICPGLPGICSFENGEASGQDESFFAKLWPADRLHPECPKDYRYCQGFGDGNDPGDDDFPWFQYGSDGIREMPSESHGIHENCGYWLCNGYGIGRGKSTVSGECIKEINVLIHDENKEVYSRYLSINDMQVSGGSNEGINKFNGEQLYHIDDVIVGIEKDNYMHTIEEHISILFDHVRGDIAMVRVVDLDFSVSKGYLVKFTDLKHQIRYFFGKTLHEAMKIRKNYQEMC